MAIPPISNNPLLKLFRTDKQGADGKDDQKQQAAQADGAATKQDVVEISAAARQRLEGAKTLANSDEARETAEETRTILEEGDQTLGLKPDFSE